MSDSICQRCGKPITCPCLEMEENNDISIYSIDRLCSIHFNLIEVELTHYPSIWLSINLDDSIFKSQVKKIWFELDAFKDFFNQVKELNLKRKGKAFLNSMSPNEFELIIENIDSCGHLICKYSLSFSEFIHDYRFNSLINRGFEIEPSTIEKIEKDIERLIKNINQN